MPVPIILGAIAAGTALYGVYKGTSGVIDHSNAADINKDAESIVYAARKHVDTQRQATNDVLVDYGARKLRAFNGVIDDFIQTFSRLKNVELSRSLELDKHQLRHRRAFGRTGVQPLRHRPQEPGYRRRRRK